MTVAELIELLKQQPQEAAVIMHSPASITTGFESEMLTYDASENDLIIDIGRSYRWGDWHNKWAKQLK
jgi:hypothetical protein